MVYILNKQAWQSIERYRFLATKIAVIEAVEATFCCVSCMYGILLQATPIHFWEGVACETTCRPEEVGHDVCLRYYHMTLVCIINVEHSRERLSVTHGQIQRS